MFFSGLKHSTPRYLLTAKRGFMLVELLVVAAIISMLAALLLPVLETSINMARISACANNVKTITAGMQFYADENNSYFPARDTQQSETYRFWYRKIFRSVSGESWSGTTSIKSSSMFFRCPKFRLPVSLGWDYPTIPYGKNDYLGAVDCIRTTSVKRPSRVIMIGDSDDDGYFGLIITSQNYALGNRHGAKVSTSFVDGHASILELVTYTAPGVIWGEMDNVGITISYTSASSVATTLHSAFLKESWGYRGSGLDYMTKQ